MRLQGLSPANPQLLTDLDTWEDHAHWEGLLAGTDDVDPSWQAWVDVAAQQLAVRSVNVAELLAIARSVAHRTVRQLAPVVAFALGVAAAQGQEPGRSRELVLAALPE